MKTPRKRELQIQETHKKSGLAVFKNATGSKLISRGF